MSDWLKALAVMYTALLLSSAYALLLTGLACLVSLWVLVPGIAVMPLLAMGAVAMLDRG